MGAHVSYADVIDSAKLNATLDYITAVGGNFLACSGSPTERVCRLRAVGADV